MAQDTVGAQGTGQEGSQAADAQHEGNAAPAAPAEATPPPPKPADTVVTAATLQGVISRVNKSTEELVKKSIDGLSKQFSDTLAAKLDEFAKATPPSKGDGGKAAHGDAATAIELEKRVKDLQTRLEQSEHARQQAEERETEYKFRTQVEAALSRNGCKRPEYGFMAIRPHLTVNAEGKIVGKVKDAVYGEADVELDKYIKDHFAEETFPELFPSKVRPGAPAGGDAANGGGNGKYLYKESDIVRIAADAERYAKERDKIEEARRTGRIQIGA